MNNSEENRGGEAGPKTGPLPSLHPLTGSASPLCDAVAKDGYHYAMHDLTAKVVPAETARELEATLREAGNVLAFLHGAFRRQLKPKDHERVERMHIRIQDTLHPQNVERRYPTND